MIESPTPAAVQTHRDEFEGYTLEPVFRRTDEKTRERVLAFWAAQAAVPDPNIARRRTQQVIYLINDPDGELVGVSTAYPSRVPMLGGDWYLIYRMFIRPQDRRAGLMRFVTTRSFELMRERRNPDGAVGVVVMAENLKLTRPGARGLFMRHGWRYAGLNRIKQETWVKRFDGAPQ